MSKYLDRAKKLRAIVTPHYNCCQSVVLCFAPDAGVSEEQAYRMAYHFAAGMRMGATCGAVSGGLMALGLFGVNDPAVIMDYYRRVKAAHDDMLNCAELLRVNAEQGREKKPHCDALVFELVTLVETILREQGKID